MIFLQIASICNIQHYSINQDLSALLQDINLIAKFSKSVILHVLAVAPSLDLVRDIRGTVKRLEKPPHACLTLRFTQLLQTPCTSTDPLPAKHPPAMYQPQPAGFALLWGDPIHGITRHALSHQIRAAQVLGFT